MVRLNLVHQFLRLALGWNHVEPAARHHQVGGKAKDPVRNGIAMVMIVEQPRIDVALTESGLNRS